MLSTYGHFSGTEIWNNQRVLSYLVGNPLLGYPGLRHPNTSVTTDCGCMNALCLFCEPGAGPGGIYTSPENDLAPWFDPDIPESAEFAGLFVEEIDGFDSVVARDMSDGAISGTSLGPLRLKGRCMTVTGWLRAKTCCGAEYGLRWLQEALLGNNFCADCATGDLYMLKCCPPDTDTCHPVLDSTTPVTTTLGVTLAISETSTGVFQITIDDPLQSNLLSNPTGGPNDANGALLSCINAGSSPKWSFASVLGANAVGTFQFPFAAITSTVPSPSGVGTSVVITVDTNITSLCDDMQRWITRFAPAARGWIDTFGDGSTNNGFSVTAIECYSVVDGVDPADYIRLLHRTGLTDGPKVTDRMGVCCDKSCGCVNLKVQFTLCSELPYIFSDIDWCVKDAPFDPDTTYCLNLKKLCNTCSNPIGTKLYERQVPRPTCGVILRHDQSWCTDGWDIDDGCPPPNCILTISGTTEFVPGTDLTTCANPSVEGGTDTCLVSLLNDGTWAETSGWSVADGFPPPFCTLDVDGSGVCNDGDPPPDPPEEPCLIRLVYNECTGAKTWEPIRWSGDVPFPVDCPCVEIAETCLIKCDDTVVPCPDPMVCPVLINCFGAWTPVGWVHDVNAAFPDPNCTYVVANVQDLSPITETVEFPADEFIPDCGVIPIPPPPPFLISTSCFCDPWETLRMCCTFKNPADWNEATSYIEINTGSSEMRRLKIEAYQNPFGDAVPCACDPNDPFWECRAPCSSILIPQLPSGARLVIDSRNRIAQLILPGGRAVNALRYLFSEDGNPFGWFDISQCSIFCIVVSVDQQFVAPDATVSIGAVGRYLTSGW